MRELPQRCAMERCRGILAVVLLVGTEMLAAAAGLDSTFGSGGRVVTPIAASGQLGAGANAVAVQSDGKIVVAGTGVTGSFAVARYDGAGVLDPNFGVAGVVQTALGSPGWGGTRPVAIAVQPDGKLLVAGRACQGIPDPIDCDFVLVRYASDGTLDAGFGSGGIVLRDLDPTGQGGANDMVLQPDGKIVLLGEDGTGPTLLRFDSTGGLDPGFGSGGIVSTPGGGSTSIAMQSDGKLVTAGAGFVVARYDTNGTLDVGFGTNGIVTTGIKPDQRDLRPHVAVQSDGKIVIAGDSEEWASFPPVVGWVRQVALVRYTTTGALDATFGTGGIALGSLGVAPEQLLIAGDGSLLVAGNAFDVGDQAFTLGRYLTDGTQDTDFHPCGDVVTRLGDQSFATAAALQGDGRVVIVGRADASGAAYALARYDTGPMLPCTPAAKGVIKVRNGLALPGLKNSIKVKWTLDGPVELADFGDPTGTTDVTACLVDDVSGAQTLRFHLAAMAAEDCDGRPCWASTASRYKYRNGSIRKLLLKSGAKRASIKAVSKGVLTDFILLPYAGTAVARAVLSDQTCWEARFETPGINLFEVFSAKTP